MFRWSAWSPANFEVELSALKPAWEWKTLSQIHSTRGRLLDDHWHDMASCKYHGDTKKQSHQWRGMACHKSRNFSEKEFLSNKKMHGWADRAKYIHFSSIVNEVVRTISSQFFFFFYEKILSIKKAPKRKTNDFRSLRSFCVAFVV